MQWRTWCIYLVLGLAVLGFATAAYASTKASSNYTIDWYDISSLASSSGESLSLTGAPGQPEGSEILSGGSYRLQGGFVGNMAEAGDHFIFLPLVLRAL